ncbi:MAG TPA: DUF3368 domain-containing protein [Chloroflexi bacterium]|nr:DUF3368 domain-containing protein [Chloroflexota bacterium]
MLPHLFPTIVVPGQVVFELDVGRSLTPDVVDPRTLDFITISAVSQTEIDRLPANRLGEGERAVIALARRSNGLIAGLDDRLARQFAIGLGLTVKGIVGLIIDARQAGLIPVAGDLLELLRRSGFRLDQQLFEAALLLAGES